MRLWLTRIRRACRYMTVTGGRPGLGAPDVVSMVGVDAIDVIRRHRAGWSILPGPADAPLPDGLHPVPDPGAAGDDALDGEDEAEDSVLLYTRLSKVLWGSVALDIHRARELLIQAESDWAFDSWELFKVHRFPLTAMCAPRAPRAARRASLPAPTPPPPRAHRAGRRPPWGGKGYI